MLRKKLTSRAGLFLVCLTTLVSAEGCNHLQNAHQFAETNVPGYQASLATLEAPSKRVVSLVGTALRVPSKLKILIEGSPQNTNVELVSLGEDDKILNRAKTDDFPDGLVPILLLSKGRKRFYLIVTKIVDKNEYQSTHQLVDLENIDESELSKDGNLLIKLDRLKKRLLGR